MKFAITLVLALLMCAPAFGQDFDLKGNMVAGGYAGYTLGMGDPFGDDNGCSFDAGIGFGGTFHYGVTPKMMVGGELGFQSYKAEVDAVTIMGFTSPGTSSSSTETNFLGSCLYALNYADDGAMFINFGAGLYGGADSEIGFFGGILYQKKLGETMNWFVMPRFHYVMTDTAMKMIQIAAGVNFAIGG